MPSSVKSLRTSASLSLVAVTPSAGQQAHYTFPESITLYVTYRTVTASAEGMPTFRDDVYGRDRRVVKAMAKP